MNCLEIVRFVSVTNLCCNEPSFPVNDKCDTASRSGISSPPHTVSRR